MAARWFSTHTFASKKTGPSTPPLSSSGRNRGRNRPPRSSGGNNTRQQQPVNTTSIANDTRDQLPFSSAVEKLGWNTRGIVFNSSHLSDAADQERILKHFASISQPAFYTSSAVAGSFAPVASFLSSVAKQCNSWPLQVEIVGLRNTGVMQVAEAVCGQRIPHASNIREEHELQIVISRNPHIVLRRPQETAPQRLNNEAGVKQAIIGIQKDSELEPHRLVEHLWTYLGKKNTDALVHALQRRLAATSAPSNSGSANAQISLLSTDGHTFVSVLQTIALLRQNYAQRKDKRYSSFSTEEKKRNIVGNNEEQVLDLDAAGLYLIQEFRAGNLGRFTLDAVPLLL